MINERAFIARFNSATPQEMIDMLLHADADEQRVLQIYLGQQQYDDIRAMGMQTRGLAQRRPSHAATSWCCTASWAASCRCSTRTIQVADLAQYLSPDGRASSTTLPVKDDGPSERDVRASGILARYYAKQIVWLEPRVECATVFLRLAHRHPQVRRRALSEHQQVVWQRSLRCTWWRTPWEAWSAAVTSCAIPTAGAKAEGWSCWALRTTARSPFRGCCSGPTTSSKPSPSSTSSTTRATCCTSPRRFPGAYQMLPVRGKRGGLDPLYRAATYTRRSREPGAARPGRDLPERNRQRDRRQPHGLRRGLQPSHRRRHSGRNAARRR